MAFKGSFSITQWDEDTLSERSEGIKVSHASIKQVYSGEMMWDMLKSAICKASEEQGYTLRTIQCDKSTVSTKSAASGIPVICWTYSLGCARRRLYQSHQTMRLFVRDGTG